MKGTISTHNGSQVSQEHNKRDAHFISNEMEKEFREKGTRHIRKDGEHEIWHHENLRDFYKRTFQKSVEEYNSKQKRDDRKIYNYYEKILFDKKKHPCYEMIVGVYGSKIPSDLCREINREFFEGWNERNPNLPLVGCYWHFDEGNLQCGHGHYDYVPVSHNCKTGPSTGTSLNLALKEMGFVDRGKETAQIQWQARENKVFAEICQKHGITIERSKEKKQHKTKDAYELEQRVEQASQRLSEADRAIEERTARIAQLDAEIAQKEAQRDSLTASLEQSADDVRQLNEDVRHAINSSKKQPIERLKETPAQKNIFGKEKSPGTSLVITQQLDELESSPGLTPADTWKLNNIEKGIRTVSSTIDNSREQQLQERVSSLEQQLREERQINRKLTDKIQRFKDWVIDIIEQELSILPSTQRFVHSIASKVRNALDSIERTSIEMSQSNDERELN